MGAHQDDVAGLGVGEYLPPAEIGVGVLQTAGQDDQHCREIGIGHLTGMVFFRMGTVHTPSGVRQSKSHGITKDRQSIFLFR